MSEADRSYMPGHRGILIDISEASGALCQLHEIVDEHGLFMVMAAIDAGMQVFEADEALFVQMQSFRTYCEMLDRDGGGYESVEETIAEGEPLQAA